MLQKISRYSPDGDKHLYLVQHDHFHQVEEHHHYHEVPVKFYVEERQTSSLTEFLVMAVVGFILTTFLLGMCI